MRLVPPAKNLARASPPTCLMAAAGSCARTYVKISMLSLSLLGILDGGHDVGVGATSAEVAAHLLPNVGVGVSMSLVQYADGGTNLPGCAVAALACAALDKRLLHRVQCLAVRQALDGCDLRAGVHDRQREAGVNAPAVHQDGAGAALPVIAALLTACQTQVFAERVKQRYAG